MLECSFSHEHNVVFLLLGFFFCISQAYDLLEILLVSICLYCHVRQQLREYPMMLALAQSGKLIWQRSIAVFICLLLHHMKRAMSGYAVLIMI